MLQLASELETFRGIATEAQAEKELLAAERTLVILHLQVTRSCLLACRLGGLLRL